jgi:hypothetical protein
VRNTKWLKNGKLRKAILSAIYNISQRNFGVLLILWCSFKLWWNFCLDQNLVYNANGPFKNTLQWTLNGFQAGRLINTKTIIYLSFQIVVVFFSNSSCFKCMHGQFRVIWLLKNCNQAMSEYSYCGNICRTFALWSKISHFISSFSCLEYAHIRSARFHFKFLFRLWWIFKSPFSFIGYAENNQRMSSNHHYFSFFSSFLHKLSNFIFIYIIN